MTPRRTIVALLALALLPVSAHVQDRSSDYKIEHRGSLQDVFEKGDLRWQMSLGDLRFKKHLFALGVLAREGGEVLVWNSVPLVTTIQNGKAKTRITWERDVAFLAWTQVEEWHPVPVPESVRSLADVAAFVPKAAAGFMLDTRRAIPFRLEGRFGAIAAQVLAPGEATGEDRIRTPPTKFRVEAVRAEILGIYSAEAKDYVPRGGSLYLQVKTQNGQIMGRVDAIESPREATLFLPR
jgi:hypothetical protein